MGGGGKNSNNHIKLNQVEVRLSGVKVGVSTVDSEHQKSPFWSDFSYILPSKVVRFWSELRKH